MTFGKKICCWFSVIISRWAEQIPVWVVVGWVDPVVEIQVCEIINEQRLNPHWGHGFLDPF